MCTHHIKLKQFGGNFSLLMLLIFSPYLSSGEYSRHHFIKFFKCFTFYIIEFILFSFCDPATILSNLIFFIRILFKIEFVPLLSFKLPFHRRVSKKYYFHLLIFFFIYRFYINQILSYHFYYTSLHPQNTFYEKIKIKIKTF